jgi:glycosyltransferase involved in cell wall biosynthesis
VLGQEIGKLFVDLQLRDIRIEIQAIKTFDFPIRFLFMGRIGHRKGTFDLINAFANLPVEQRRRALLLLAGDGDIEYGQKMSKNLNLISEISFLGWIDPVKRNNLLTNSDVFILPSYHEGLPMALLEAMGWGLPVITTPVGGIPEVVTSYRNGLLIPPGDVQKLTEAMKLLIEDETFRIRLGNCARTTAERFDVNVYTRSLAGIYHSTLRSF